MIASTRILPSGRRVCKNGRIEATSLARKKDLPCRPRGEAPGQGEGAEMRCGVGWSARRGVIGRVGALTLLCLAAIMVPRGHAADDKTGGEESDAGDEEQGDPASAEMPGEDGPFSIRGPNYSLVPDDREHDYFGVVGAPRLSSIPRIRSAFRRMASRYRQHLMGRVPDAARPRSQAPPRSKKTFGAGAGGGAGVLKDVVLEDEEPEEPVDPEAERRRSYSHTILDFVRATEAYRVLTRPQDKRRFEVSGSDGLRRAAAGPRFEDPLRDAYTLELGFKTGAFKMEFGFKEGQKKSTGNVHHNIKIPMIGFYTGMHMDIAIVRAELCPFCNGTGAAENAEMLVCNKCSGEGKLSLSSHWRSKRAIKERREGGIDRTVTVGCQRCQGSGKLPSEPCPKCKGEKTVEGKHTVTVHVEPGMLEGHAFTFKEQAEQAPDAVAGDVILHVGSEEHDDFEREGSDLVCKRNITLAEALLGFKMEIKHLDGRMIEIERNEVTKPGQDHEVPGMGMPIHGKAGQFGKLIVKLNIVFPERIAVDEERARDLRRADERAKKRRSKGWRGWFAGEGEGEEDEGADHEGDDEEEDEEDDEEDGQQQESTRRKRKVRAPREEDEDDSRAQGGAAGSKKGVGMYVEPVYAQSGGEGGGQKIQTGLRVKGLLEGSPAAQSGAIKVGDALVKVGGVAVGMMRLKELAPLLLGPQGSVVSITLRGQDGSQYEVELERGDPIVNKKEEL